MSWTKVDLPSDTRHAWKRLIVYSYKVMKNIDLKRKTFIILIYVCMNEKIKIFLGCMLNVVNKLVLLQNSPFNIAELFY